ncbi:unnamed protein product [Citrullus colocynthis]|uniref:Uncharacterized protein n=1 Tax=Citrullus colocynthis TaxID=252529 RepID=A0ABP0YGT9_9ROSI
MPMLHGLDYNPLPAQPVSPFLFPSHSLYYLPIPAVLSPPAPLSPLFFSLLTVKSKPCPSLYGHRRRRKINLFFLVGILLEIKNRRPYYDMHEKKTQLGHGKIDQVTVAVTAAALAVDLRSVAMLIVVAVSLLILPLVLPPLPPPPVLLLFVPVLIMSLLLFLALSPSQVPAEEHRVADGGGGQNSA